MKSKVILGIEERGKVEERLRQYDWLHFPVKGTLLFLTMYLDTFFHWGVESMFPLLHYGEASDHSRSGVTWLLKLYKGIQLLPSFLVMLTLGTCPHDGGRPSSSKEVLLTAPSEVVTDSHSNHQTWRAVSVWMSGVLAMELPQLRSWCGEEVSLTYPSRIPNWPTEPASTVIAALYHSVSFHAAMVAQQLAWRKRSGNNES